MNKIITDLTTQQGSDFFNVKSPEMLINMKPSDIPPVGSSDRLAFIQNELKKCREGVNINGQFIVPNLYYHLNFHTIQLDQKDHTGKIIRIATKPYLRDNEWIIHTEYYEAQQAQKAYIIGGSRQIAKSDSIVSLTCRELFCYDGAEAMGLFSISADKDTFNKKLQVALADKSNFLVIPNIDKDLTQTEIRFGLTRKNNEPVILSRLYTYLTKEGKATEIGAGKSLSFFFYEEIAKANCREAYEAVKPALLSEFGYRCAPLLVFCVCAGTKVWNNAGSLVSIEDLNPNDGILGFDTNNAHVAPEQITYWQAPQSKACVRITTISGRTLECSEDHPVYSRTPYPYSNAAYRKDFGYRDAGKLEPGMQLAVADEVDVWGSNRMNDPLLIGWLVGDGTYGKGQTPRIINTDKEILEYVDTNYQTFTGNPDTVTATGKLLKKTCIKGIIPELRRIGIYGQTKDNKRLPVDLHSYTKEDVCLFLRGYFDADGCAYINGQHNACLVKVSSANLEILKETQLILQKLGIHSKLYWCKPNFNNLKTTRGHWNLNINAKESLIRFHDLIGFTVGYKKTILEKIYQLKINSTSRKSSPKPGMQFETIASVESIGIQPVYNLTTSNTHTYLANGIITHNTGGNVEKSRDAINMFTNPASNNVMEFDTDGKRTGKFMGGWYRQDLKYKTSLAAYLGKPVEGELGAMEIRVTDFEKANSILDAEIVRAQTDKDPNAVTKQKMYYPRTLEEMSLSAQESPFKRYREQLKKHQQWLYDTKPGKAASFFRDYAGEVKYSFVDAVPVSNFPHKDTDDIENTPVMIYDDVKHKGVYHLHVGGLDPYNVGQTETSPSLGAFYLMRRHYGDLSDPYQDTMVASYVARPERVEYFHRKIKEVLDYYSGSMLHESSNDMVLEFFDKDFKADQYLGKSWNLKAEISPQSSYKGAYGIPPTPAFQRAWMNRIIEYISEPIGVSDTGEQILGYTRILDPMLIEEMLQWKPDTNVDRLVSFGHALLYMGALDKYDKPAVVKPVTREEPEKRFSKQVWGISNSSRSLLTTRKPFGFK